MQRKTHENKCHRRVFRMYVGDAQVLRDGTVAMAFQKTFDPPVPGVEGGGYDVGLALIKA
jgi:hypothetical protein